MTNLTKHDINVLAKIKDPEASPLLHRVKIDNSIPPDPNVRGDDYQTAKTLELDAIRKVAKKGNFGFPIEPSSEDTEILLDDLTALISKFPKYASARNNRVQALRTIYGDGLLNIKAQKSRELQKEELEEGTRSNVAELALIDLTTAINLLTAASMDTPISPRSSQTLGNLHTQRATIYNTTAKLLTTPDSVLNVPVMEKSKDGQEVELKSVTDFEKQAHREFQLGAWYGNELAEKMVTATNPMAKLCGEIVSNAMRKEIEGYNAE